MRYSGKAGVKDGRRDKCVPGIVRMLKKIELLNQQFPNLGLDEVTGKMKAINKINERLSKHNENNQK